MWPTATAAWLTLRGPPSRCTDQRNILRNSRTSSVHHFAGSHEANAVDPGGGNNERWSTYERGDLGVVAKGEHKGEPSVLAKARHAAFCVDRLKSPHIILAEWIFSEVTYAYHYSLFMFPALCALSCGAVANIGPRQY